MLYTVLGKNFGLGNIISSRWR